MEAAGEPVWLGDIDLEIEHEDGQRDGHVDEIEIQEERLPQPLMNGHEEEEERLIGCQAEEICSGRGENPKECCQLM